MQRARQLFQLASIVSSNPPVTQDSRVFLPTILRILPQREEPVFLSWWCPLFLPGHRPGVGLWPTVRPSAVSPALVPGPSWFPPRACVVRTVGVRGFPGGVFPRPTFVSPGIPLHAATPRAVVFLPCPL